MHLLRVAVPPGRTPRSPWVFSTSIYLVSTGAREPWTSVLICDRRLLAAGSVTCTMKRKRTSHQSSPPGFWELGGHKVQGGEKMEGQHSAPLCQHGTGRPGIPMQEGDRGTDCLRVTRGPKLRGSFSAPPSSER